MKKSRIILPAAALLALSSAAAVTGTVAWFTANRIKTVSYSGVVAVNPEQGLELDRCANVANTTVSGSVSTGFSVAHNRLRDASYDMSADTLYGSVLSESTGEVTGYAVKAIATADIKKYGGNDVFFATQYEMDFKVTRVESAYNQCLMFDVANSTITGTITADDDVNHRESIVKALRIGIKVDSSHWVVWAPKSEETTLTNIKATALAAASIEETERQIIGTGTALDSDDAAPIAKATMDADVRFLGVLSTSATTVTVTTWFEGLDPACINEALDFEQAYSGQLQFAMRRAAKS